jgi:hypothetical protein
MMAEKWLNSRREGTFLLNVSHYNASLPRIGAAPPQAELEA